MAFSEKELNYLLDSDFLLTKQQIIKKLVTLFAQTEEQLKEPVISNQDIYPDNALALAGKIGKGDNYQGLPYIVLDYPRYFSGSSMFLFRTMYWWSDRFSFTLFLKGERLFHYREALVNNLEPLMSSQPWIGVNASPWEYHYQPGNFRKASEFSTHELIHHLRNHPFVKVSYTMETRSYSELPLRAVHHFQQLISLLT